MVTQVRTGKAGTRSGKGYWQARASGRQSSCPETRSQLPGTVLTTVSSSRQCPHVTDGKAEAQTGSVTCTWPHGSYGRPGSKAMPQPWGSQPQKCAGW